VFARNTWTTAFARMRAKARFTIQPRARRSTSAGYEVSPIPGRGGGRYNAAKFATEARSAQLLWRPPPRPHFHIATRSPRSCYAERGAELCVRASARNRCPWDSHERSLGNSRAYRPQKSVISGYSGLRRKHDWTTAPGRHGRQRWSPKAGPPSSSNRFYRANFSPGCARRRATQSSPALGIARARGTRCRQFPGRGGGRYNSSRSSMAIPISEHSASSSSRKVLFL